MFRAKLFGNAAIWPLLLANSILCVVGSPEQSVCRFVELFTSCFHCHRYDAFDERTTASLLEPHKCTLFAAETPPTFILYDVNAMEGFNLRRDVYIRLAVFVAAMRQSAAQYRNAFLVLPPFYRLYHWNVAGQRPDNSDQAIFWDNFFDLDSMQAYTPVLDMWQYFALMRDCFGATGVDGVRIDHAFKLRHFQSMFESGRFTERFQVDTGDCDRRWHGQLIDIYGNFSIAHVHCVQFQGSASLLKDLLAQYLDRAKPRPQTLVIINAETVLHDHWGGVEYWRARRSMRFNQRLVNIANIYRKQVLNSTDRTDKIEHPPDWRAETEHRSAAGGSYLCAHLRRRDFLSGRDRTTPTLRSAAKQISNKLKELGLSTVFISSDCTGQEFHDLRSYLMRFRVTKFVAPRDRQRLEPGAVAIIDQIICSKSSYFIGTYESTFTYRIYEEREILSFRGETTFNTFCKESDDTVNCTRNSVWPIVF